MLPLPQVHPVPGSPAFETLTADAAQVLLAHARTLQAAALPPLPLRGKNIGLLCEASGPDGLPGDADLFLEAATALGAQVARIKPSLSDASPAQEVHDTARLLGRFYDAVACEGLPHPLVRQLSGHAGVPVYDGIASPQHPLATLAVQLGGDAPLPLKRRWLLQAALMQTLA